MTTWRELIADCLEKNPLLSRERVIECTLSEKELDIEFDNGWGGTEGRDFTAWTENFVLFPICYDGSEWVGFAPRNPCKICMCHQGG